MHIATSASPLGNVVHILGLAIAHDRVAEQSA